MGLSMLVTKISQFINAPALASSTGRHDEHSEPALQPLASGGVVGSQGVEPASGPPTQNAWTPGQSAVLVHSVPKRQVSPGARFGHLLTLVPQAAPETLHIPAQRLRLVHDF